MAEALLTSFVTRVRFRTSVISPLKFVWNLGNMYLLFFFLYFFFSFFGRESIALIKLLQYSMARKWLRIAAVLVFLPSRVIASSLLIVSFIQVVLKEVQDVLNHPVSSSVAGERGALKSKSLPSWAPSESKKLQNLWRESALWGWTIWRMIPSTTGVVWQLQKTPHGMFEWANWAAISVNGLCKWTFIIWARVSMNSHSFVYSPKQLKVQI